MSLKTRAVLIAMMLAAALVSALVAYDVARAENQVPQDRPSKHPNQQSVGRLFKGHFRTTTHGGDTEWVCLANSAGGGDVVPWNSIVQVHGAADGFFCFTMTIDGDEIAIDTTTGVITDSVGPDGAGSCHKITDGETQTWILDPFPFADKTNGVMRRDGVCLADAGYTGAPCVDNDECDGPDAGLTCYGGTVDGGVADGGHNDAGTYQGTTNYPGITQAHRIKGAYVCWTAGAVDGVHVE